MNSKRYNLTFPENNIYLVEKFNGGTAINTIAGLLKFEFNFDEKVCNTIVNKLIEANDSLRIKIYEENSYAYQVVQDYIYEDIACFDMSNKKEKEIEKYMYDNVHIPFEFINSKLYEFKIIRYNSNSGCIFMKLHHTVSDAWTLGQIINQLVKLYNDCLNNTDQNYVIPSYLEFVESEKEYVESEKYIKDEEFWREYLNNIQSPVSLKEVTSKVSTKANRYSIMLDKEINNKIKEYTKVNKVSPYTLFLAALSTYIYRIKDENDFIIGTPVLNRSNFKEKQILGMFVSTIPTRIKIEENIKFLDLVKQLGNDTMSLFRHQKYPITKILEYIHGTTDIKGKIYNVMLSYQNARSNIEENSKQLSTKWLFSGYIQDDLEIHILDMDNDGILHINYDYLTDLFKNVEIKYLHTRIMSIIQNAVEDIEINVDNVNIMSKEEKNKILHDFNDTHTNYPKNKSVIQLFEEQVKKNPDNIAVIFDNKSLTYKEINERANSLAYYLKNKKNIKVNDAVGIMMDKCIDIITSVLSVLKLGATYVPIETNIPDERRVYIIENSGINLILVNNLKEYKEYNSFDICDFDFNNNIENVNMNVDSNSNVYIMYTSGTTGKPKGVKVNSRNIIRLVVNTNYIKFSKRDRIGQIGSIAFDASTFEYWGALLNGLPLYLIKKEVLLNPVELEKYIKYNKISVMLITTALCNQLIDFNVKMFNKLRVLLTGGDTISPKHVNKIIDNCPNIQLINAYGPTENGTISTCYKITKKGTNKIPIGKPIANSLCYILDRKLRLMPIQTTGELVVSGDGVSSGYINNAELTAEKFIHDIFNPKYLCYKTGDIACYNFEGDIEFFGRKDNQIKIRGFRVELDEIRKTILNYNSKIDDAFVFLNQTDFEVKNIVACIVAKSNIDIKILNKYLISKLPIYMIPQLITQIDVIPLNNSGKVDIKEVNLKIKHSNVNILKEKTIRSKYYKEIYNILSKLIMKDDIEDNVSIFEYGLDSLIAIRVAIILSSKFSIDVEPKDILENDTILKLEQLISTKLKKDILIFPKKRDRYTLTSSQKGIFNSYMLNPESIVYNVPFEIKLGKNIDKNKIIDSIKNTILNHLSLFLKIFMEKGMVYTKIVKENINIDFANVSDEEYVNIKNKFVKPFDLLNDRLFKISAFATESNIYLLCDFHHIIFDGYSFDIFLKDIQKSYLGLKIEKEEITSGQYALFCEEQKHKHNYLNAKEYFIEKLDGELPVTSLSTDFTRQKERLFKGKKIISTINNDLRRNLIDYSIKNNITLNNVFLGIFNFLLSKYTYNEDIVIGVATIGRKYKQELNTIGMFVKTFPYRIQIDLNNSLIDYLKTTQQLMLEIIKNNEYSLDEIVKDIKVKRDISRNPIFDIMYVFQNGDTSNLFLNDSKLEINEIETNTSKFDITFSVFLKENCIELKVEYDVSLYKQSTIEIFMSHFINALEYVSSHNNVYLKNIEIISDNDKNNILNVINNTKTNYPKDKTVHGLFEEQVKKNEDKLAVVFEDENLTYNELNMKANQLSHYLIENGIKKGDVIALMLDKSIEYMIGVLAILKSNAIYMPLNKDIPDERLKYMLIDSSTKCILTINKYKKEITHLPIIDIDLDCKIYESDKINNLDLKEDSDSIAYVMYTSGTTGLPKGNMIIHKGITRLVLNTNYVEYTADDIMLVSGSLTFDTSGFEIWSAMIYGMTLHLISKDNILNPIEYEKYIYEKMITTTLIPTPIFNKLVEYNPKMFDKLKTLYVCGDVLLTNYANLILDNCKNTKLINTYGPTENAVICSALYVDHKYENNIPIGRPISNATCFIVDKCENLCPINVPGDLYTGGDGLGLGYINREELTKEKFAYVKCLKEKIYKTGDLTSWNEDGTIKFMGRIDSQIKIRGQRVELLEIQNKMLEINSIKEVTIKCQEDNTQNKHLIAYYTLKNMIHENEIIEYLSKYLPSYMIPSKFVVLKEMPLNQNGKIDKKLLPKVNFEQQASIRQPENQEQKEILEIFKKVLNNHNIGIENDFFENGGDSLMVIKLVVEFTISGFNISYADLFKYKTVLDIYNFLYTHQEKSSISESIDDLDYTKINNLLNKQNITKYRKEKNVKNVLLVGMTGFLGIHVLESLVNSGIDKVYCLVREKDDENIYNRANEKLKFFFRTNEVNKINEHLVLLNGDITDTNIIKNGFINQEIINKIDVVINCAAHVKHFGDINKFESINVKGTQNIVDFCLKNNKELIHISTISVSGNLIEGGQIIQKNIKDNISYDETKFYVGQNLDNAYAYTKFIAEKIVYDAIINNNLKAKVIRVGNLTGRYRDGRFQPNVEENAFSNRIKTFINLRVIPENISKLYIEMTPIDYASNAIVKIAMNDFDTILFHLYNHNHVSISNVIEMFDEMGIRMKTISNDDMKLLINKFINDREKTELLNGILFDLDREGKLEYNTNIVINSKRTIEILESVNFKWPEISKQYFIRYIEYLKEIGFLSF
jgi:amino acid adenylation domain-containing protein/thioester reductase-like protein